VTGREVAVTVTVAALTVGVAVEIDTVGAPVGVSVGSTTTGSAVGTGSAGPQAARLRKIIPKTMKGMRGIYFSYLLNCEWRTFE
jgi:hypothetical protein